MVLRAASLLVRLSFSILVVWFAIGLYTTEPDEYTVDTMPDDVVDALRGLGESVHADAGDRMQELFPEGYFITHVAYGLAWVEVGMRHPVGDALRTEAIEEASFALERARSNDGRAVFNSTLEPRYGIAYAGWLNWLRGGVILLEGADSARREAFRRDCDAIAAAFEASDEPYLETYEDARWPPDTIFGVAALSLHDHIYAPKYGPTIDRWVRQTRDRLDPKLGMFPHYSRHTDEAVFGSRGTAMGLIVRLLFDIDRDYGLEQYELYRESFPTARLGILPGIREYPKGRAGEGDIDSGPLFFGISLPATSFGMAASRIYGDRAVHDPLLRTLEAFGFSYTIGERRRYGFGLLPAGEALHVWSLTARPWISEPARATEREPVVATGWLAIWVAFLAALLCLVWSPEIVRGVRRRFHRVRDVVE